MKSFTVANTVRGIGFCLGLGVMSVAAPLSWFSVQWFLALVATGVSSYLGVWPYVKEFDGQRTSSRVYNSTAILAVLLLLAISALGGSLPFYRHAVTWFAVSASVLYLGALTLRPQVATEQAVQTAREVVTLRVAELHDAQKEGVALHPSLFERMGVGPGEEIELIGGFLGSRYANGLLLPVEGPDLDSTKVYISAKKLRELGLPVGASVRVGYYAPTMMSDTVEGGMQLAVGDLDWANGSESGQPSEASR